MLRAHQSHFCLRVIAEDRDFQSDVSDIQTETEQICQEEQREWGNCRTEKMGLRTDRQLALLTTQ